MNNSTKKRNKKMTGRSIVSVLLIVAVLVAGAFAFLTAQDSKTNVFTIGNANIELWEEFDTDLDGNPEVYDATQKTPPTAENIMPGQSVIKNPYIVNNGSTDSWTYMAVGIPTSNQIFRNNEKADVVLSESTQKIEVKAFAVQKGYGDQNTVDGVYNSYFTPEILRSVLGEEATNTETELFALTGINSTTHEAANNNWIFMDSYDVDGMKYYIYGYQNILASNTDTSATPLFTAAVLNSNIGSIGRNPLVHTATPTFPETFNDVDLSKYIMMVSEYDPVTDEEYQYAYSDLSKAEIIELMIADYKDSEKAEAREEYNNTLIWSSSFPYSSLDEFFDSSTGKERWLVVYDKATGLTAEIGPEREEPDGYVVEVGYDQTISGGTFTINGDTVLGLLIDSVYLSCDNLENTTFSISDFTDETNVEIVYCGDNDIAAFNANMFDGSQNVASIHFGYETYQPSEALVNAFETITNNYAFVENIGYVK